MARKVLLVCVAACVCAVIVGVASTAGNTAQALVQAPTLDSGAWPMLGHDIGLTGKSPYLGAQTSAIKWSLSTGSPVRSSAAIGSDGTVYVGGGNHVLYALNPADGSTKWTRTLGSSIWSSPAISSDGVVFVACYDGNLYAVNTADGTVKWSAPIGVGAYSSPTIGTDGSVYCGSYDTTMYAFNADGSVKWTQKAGGSAFTCPSIGSTGTVYMAKGSLCAFDPSTGSVEWTFVAGDFGGLYNSPAIGADGTLFFGSTTGNVYALDPMTHTPKWTQSLGSVIVNTSPAIDASGTIYVGCSDGSLYALDSSNGHVKWSAATGAPIWSAPVIGSDGTIYLGNGNNATSNDTGTVEALDPADGSVKWSYVIPNYGRSTAYPSPAIGADGTVYVGSDNGTFYAFGAAGTGTFTLTYHAGADGSIVGSATQVVNYNASGSAVTAQADTGYHFVKWSDGSTANPRTDTHVTASKSVTANFALSASLTITKCPSHVKHGYTFQVHGTVTPILGHIHITRYRWLHQKWVDYGRYNLIGTAEGTWVADVSTLYKGSWRFIVHANGLSVAAGVTAK